MRVVPLLRVRGVVCSPSRVLIEAALSSPFGFPRFAPDVQSSRFKDCKCSLYMALATMPLLCEIEYLIELIPRLGIHSPTPCQDHRH
jgi:hypothetical protein